MAAINRILFWKSILKRELGSKVSLLVLRKQAKLGAETFSTAHLLMPKEEVIQKLCQAT